MADYGAWIGISDREFLVAGRSESGAVGTADYFTPWHKRWIKGCTMMSVHMVGAGAGTVVGPAAGVAALCGVLDVQRQWHVSHAVQAEVEPLPVLATAVLADAQPDVVGARRVHHLDVAAVEGSTDGDRRTRTQGCLASTGRAAFSSASANCTTDMA